MLTRIYGVAFEKKDEHSQHTSSFSKKPRTRPPTHRKRLELFRITNDYGGGLVLWLPNGAYIRKNIEDFWRETHLKRGYELLFTPHRPRTLRDRSATPSTTPTRCTGDQRRRGAVRCQADEPPVPHRGVQLGAVRTAAAGSVRRAGHRHRHERSGALHGLMRVRGFTQDDAHIFCTRELPKTSRCMLDIAQLMYSTFGFPEYKVELSVRDSQNTDKYQGDDAIWDLSEATLAKVLEDRGIEYKRIEGEAAFYGPKIDVKVVDAIGRTWQLTTVQLDFNQPERFDLTYVGADNTTHRPIMIHRALLGSIERFFGILIEHYAGSFPAWLAPVQAKILPVSQKFAEYGQTVTERFRAAGLRVKLDDDSEKLGPNPSGRARRWHHRGGRSRGRCRHRGCAAASRRRPRHNDHRRLHRARAG